MDLQEFIKQSLVQIVAGIVDAQKEVEANGATINPSGLILVPEKVSGHARTDDGNVTQNIEFDVAVTSTEGTGSKGGVGIAIGVVALGTQANSQQSSQAVSRLRFTVPILLPTQRLGDTDLVKERQRKGTEEAIRSLQNPRSQFSPEF